MTLEGIDVQLLVYLNSLGSEFWDPLWIVLTNKLTYIPLFIFIVFYLLWCTHFFKNIYCSMDYHYFNFNFSKP